MPRSFLRTRLPLAANLATAPVGVALDDCPPIGGSLWLTFDMLNPDLDYMQAVDHFEVMFYDMSGPESTDPATIGEPTPGKLVYHFEYTLDDLRPSDYAAQVVGVAPGYYHVLAIFNDDDHTETRDYEQYADIHSILLGENLNFAPENDALSGEARVMVRENTDQEKNITLLRHNNDITLHILYDGYELPEGTRLETHISGNNGLFDYSDHATHEGYHVESHPWERVPEDEEQLPIQFKMTTMRLSGDRSDLIHLEEVPIDGTRSDGGQSISLDMSDELAREVDEHGNFIFDTDSELERHNEYEITVTLGAGLTLLSVDVRVVGWDETGGGVEI